MLRPWPILLGLTGLSWMIRLARWAQAGYLTPLTVGDVAAALGLAPPRPPATPWGDVLAAVLAADFGMFCLILAVAALVIDATTPRRFGH